MKISIGFSLFIFIVLFSKGWASYCGQAGIPYSLEILSNGQTVLGCARPSCFGWDASGRRSADPAQFYKIGEKVDGFIRPNDKKGPIAFNSTTFKPQYSICDRSYISNSCSGNSWVGGIAPNPTIEAKGNPMKLMCCYYNKLADAKNEGQTELRKGQTIQGGEQLNDKGRQQSFEYIANIQRLFDRNGVVYIVQMKRFVCLPRPTTSALGVLVEKDTDKFLIENINAQWQPPQQQQQQPPQQQQTKQELLIFQPKQQLVGSSAKPFDNQKFKLRTNIPKQDLPKKNKLSAKAYNSFDYQQDEEALEKVYPIEQQASQTLYKKEPLPLAKSMQEINTYSRPKNYQFSQNVQNQPPPTNTQYSASNQQYNQNTVQNQPQQQQTNNYQPQQQQQTNNYQPQQQQKTNNYQPQQQYTQQIQNGQQQQQTNNYQPQQQQQTNNYQPQQQQQINNYQPQQQTNNYQPQQQQQTNNYPPQQQYTQQIQNGQQQQQTNNYQPQQQTNNYQQQYTQQIQNGQQQQNGFGQPQQYYNQQTSPVQNNWLGFNQPQQQFGQSVIPNQLGYSQQNQVYYPQQQQYSQQQVLPQQQQAVHYQNQQYPQQQSLTQQQYGQQQVLPQQEQQQVAQYQNKNLQPQNQQYSQQQFPQQQQAQYSQQNTQGGGPVHQAFQHTPLDHTLSPFHHTFPPHTFPTHTFPTHTFPPHTFPPHTFPPHTFPPIVDHTISPLQHTLPPHTPFPYTLAPMPTFPPIFPGMSLETGQRASSGSRIVPGNTASGSSSSSAIAPALTAHSMSPLPIPTAEDIENAIPSEGRRLIVDMTRTFLGNRFIF